MCLEGDCEGFDSYAIIFAYCLHSAARSIVMGQVTPQGPDLLATIGSTQCNSEFHLGSLAAGCNRGVA